MDLEHVVHENCEMRKYKLIRDLHILAHFVAAIIKQRITCIENYNLQTFIPSVTSISTHKSQPQIIIQFCEELTKHAINISFRNCRALRLKDLPNRYPEVSNNIVGNKNSIYFTISPKECPLYCENFSKKVSVILDVIKNRNFLNTFEVPCRLFRNWYIKNIAQGYLLKHIFRTIQILTLDCMQNTYFVLIRADTQNINVKLCFSVDKEIIKIDLINPVTDFSYGENCEQQSFEVAEAISAEESETTSNVNATGKISQVIFKDKTVSDSGSLYFKPEKISSASWTYFDYFADAPSVESSANTVITFKKNTGTSALFFALPRCSLVNVGVGTTAYLDLLSEIEPNVRFCHPKNMFKGYMLKNPCNLSDECLFEHLPIIKNMTYVLCGATAPSFYTVFLKYLGQSLLTYLIWNVLF